jgi:hypothetical protein
LQTLPNPAPTEEPLPAPVPDELTPGQQAVLGALTDEWWSVAEVRAVVEPEVYGLSVQYRLKELRSFGLVEYREDSTTHTGRWRRAVEGADA